MAEEAGISFELTVLQQVIYSQRFVKRSYYGSINRKFHKNFSLGIII